MSSFQQQIEAFAKKTQKNLDTVVRETCFNVSSEIQLRTPVKTGMARNNWMPAIDRPDVRVGPWAEQPIRPVANKAYGRIYYFTNSLPYIRKLEYGWSKQAPNGMVRLAVQNFKKQLREAINGVK